MPETELSAVDVAVIGSGIAGLFLAVECARSGLSVAVVTKKESPPLRLIGLKGALQEFLIQMIQKRWSRMSEIRLKQVLDFVMKPWSGG